ncbi:alanyl-tRNA synthetase [Kitasatospora sp. GP30]|uniref:alanine--tRNA ligase n=1 Tax=Kitasatospora sp. GP30 TaxID=3035084 RepID=UPI000C70B50A|nr:alanine--tRNA ligase [Kitasatospora sp. GP30]MDH6138464.1 alanyl-tRNA synthetase [Kitasatospora sp. GP30]
MQTHELSQRFQNYFTARGHVFVPSAPLILDDPNLLFVNAGMVPFKPYFLGEVTPLSSRVTSVQKCVRTGDIDEVGKATRYNTFFQMAGNFSFGDYFREEAITWAWDLVTTSQSDGGLGLDPNRIWVTVYEEDDEAVRLWQKIAGLPLERIQRLGMEHNFWSMGVPGPCGPCSEIFYDRGPAFGPDGGPAVDTERFLEIWNLVFMESERGAGTGKGAFPILGSLPARNIDTGMGLERTSVVLQDVPNVYETDLLRPVITKAEELIGRKYGSSHEADVLFRIIADHARSGVMLIADGVTPGNEARGYVLRRLLRRIVRSTRLLGVKEPVLGEFATVVRDMMTPSYPELAKGFQRISTIMQAEENTFLSTLTSGMKIFDMAVEESKSAGNSKLPGGKAFQLHDTYGFPIDLTLEMAAEQGLSVDEEGFRRLMKEQRDRAKADAKAKKMGHADLSAYRQVADSAGRTTFTGYTANEGEATILGLLVDGVPSPAAHEGDEVEVILDRTPFYAEGGGQLADTGRIRLETGAIIEVRDVQQPVPGVSVHEGIVKVGEVTLGANAFAQIDLVRRRAIARAHSATHLTHQALRDALGPTAAQAGSENAPGRFRFDFGSPTAVPGTVLLDVEQKINEVLARELDVRAEVMSMDEARKQGAIAEFGEKYGSEVRVVTIGDFSKELCGGTHVGNTAQLGLVKLLGESSIGSGVRRVEALVGVDAYNFLAREHTVVSQLSEIVNARPEELPERISGVLLKLKEAEREIDRFRAQKVLEAAAGLAEEAKDINGVAVVLARVSDDPSADDLRKLVLDVRSRITGRGPAVVAVFAVSNNRPLVVVATNEAARERGVKAGELVRTAAKALGGGGGGKDDVAQGGGSNPLAINEAIAQVERAVAQR